MDKYILGIDIGTSSTKGILINTDGKIIAQAKQSYDLDTPAADWAQEDADVWLRAVTKVIKTLAANVDSADIIAVGIDGLYGGSGIPVDKDGKPLYPALIWMDRRATKQTDEVHDLVSDDELMQTTGNLADPYYGFTKLMWLKENEPAVYDKTALFLPPESYVIYKYTGQLSMNYSAAGNLAGVFDINNKQWSPELDEKLSIDVNKLPADFVASTQVAGRLSDDWAAKLGLQPGTPFFNTGVDVGPATVSTGVFDSGNVTVAVGTSMNAALITEKPILNNDLIIWPYAYKPNDYYYNFAGANTAGAIVAWFIKEFGQDLTNGTQQLDEQSQTVPAGSNGLMVLPYFMGERSPIWDSNVKGTILGLSLNTTRADVYNAFQEAIAYSVRQSIEQFGDQLGDTITLVGGVSNSPKMVQLIANVTGKTVMTTDAGGEADLGSAILAGIGMDVITPKEAESWNDINQKYTPNPEIHEQYNTYYQLYKLAYQNVKDYYKTYNDDTNKLNK